MPQIFDHDASNVAAHMVGKASNIARYIFGEAWDFESHIFGYASNVARIFGGEPQIMHVILSAHPLILNALFMVCT